MISRAFLVFIFLGCVCIAAAQGPPPKPAPPATSSSSEKDLFGSVKDGIYRNGFLGFEVRVPEGWLVLSRAETDIAKEVGGEGLKSGSAAYDKELDEALENELVVLTLAKKPLGTPGNSAIAFGITKQPAGVTPRMVAEESKSILLGNPKGKLVRDVQVETISGNAFARFDVELGIYGDRIPLRYYVTMVRSYSLTVSISSLDAAAVEIMETTLRSIAFKR